MAKTNGATKYMGLNGPTSSVSTTFGVNSSRISNIRPTLLTEEVSIPATIGVLSDFNQVIGRHRFCAVFLPAMQPVNVIAGIPTKAADYVVTSTGARLIASQLMYTKRIGNGKTHVELSLPYYDNDAFETLVGSDLPGAIAPVGSFKVEINVLGGGVLTGTSAADMNHLDDLMLSMVRDCLASLGDPGNTEPLLAAASHGILPLASGT